jgi:UDP-N-acetylglucosamine acyltransferase
VITTHPTAVVSEGATIGPRVVVGPFVVIEDNVEVAEDTELTTGTVLLQGTRIGARCKLGPYAVIGGLPMDGTYQGEASLAIIEDEVELREFTTVHRATGEGAETRVGAGSLVMTYTHVSHNVEVGRGVTLATSVQLGGHVQVGDYAFLGANALVHQFCRVGKHAIMAGGSATSKDILPHCIAANTPATHYGLNRVGLRRRGFAGERYAALEKAIRALRRNDKAQFEELADYCPDVKTMKYFRDSSQRGIAPFAVRRT